MSTFAPCLSSDSLYLHKYSVGIAKNTVVPICEQCRQNLYSFKNKTIFWYRLFLIQVFFVRLLQPNRPLTILTRCLSPHHSFLPTRNSILNLRYFTSESFVETTIFLQNIFEFMKKLSNVSSHVYHISIITVWYIFKVGN